MQAPIWADMLPDALYYREFSTNCRGHSHSCLRDIRDMISAILVRLYCIIWLLE